MLTIHLSIVIFLPLAAGVVALFLPGRLARWVVLLGTLGVAAYAVAMVIDFEPGTKGLRYVTDDSWIDELGIRWSLGVDGLNLFLLALTAFLWPLAALFATRSEWDRPRLFWFNMALAETAVLGAFCAQDLILFVFFFDLMLVPFYFLIGAWGEGDRVRATTRFVIYTLVGSLLMLAAAVALGVLATPDGGSISYSLADLAQNPVSKGSQEWIFLLFALAFLVKAPAFPFHGWMPDTYRATPLPVLILLSAVLSKVGMYGFLRIVLPLMPDASEHFRDLMLAIAVISILYGSVLALSQDHVRLVVGYSSIAQLGFILLGIFALDPRGAEGALFQMVNHGLAAAGAFIIIGLVYARTRTEYLSEMGGAAFRAPVLAAMFLIISFALLAMPGSGNFIGEFMVLFGVFGDRLVWGLVGSVGVVLAAGYAIRLFQGTMHGRGLDRDDLAPRDLRAGELLAIVPVVLAVIALGLYPQLFLDRSDAAVAPVVDVQAGVVP